MRDEFGREIPGRGGNSGRGGGVRPFDNNNNNNNDDDDDNVTPVGNDDGQRRRAYNNNNNEYEDGGGGGGHYRNSTGTVDVAGRNNNTNYYNHHQQQQQQPTESSFGLNQPLSSSRYSTAGVISSGGYQQQQQQQQRPQLHQPQHQRQQQQPVPLSNQQQQQQLLVQPQKPRTNHPSYQYTLEPMMCEFLYNAEMEKETSLQQQQNSKDAETGGVGDTTNTHENESRTTRMTYTDYTNRYCLQYIRAFLNVHIDDVWFRYQYSPFHTYHTFQHDRIQHNTIAVEGPALKQLLQQMTQKLLMINTDDDNNDGTSEINEYMDTHVRLWERRMIGGGGSGGECHNSTMTSIEQPSKPQQQSIVLETPRAHLFTFQPAATAMTTPTGGTISTPTRAIRIMEIPAMVTDAHIMTALQNIVALQPPPPQQHQQQQRDGGEENDHSSEYSPLLRIFPGQQQQYYSNKKQMIRWNYPRDIVVVATSTTIQWIIQYLSMNNHTNNDHNNNNNNKSMLTTMVGSSPDRTDVPRKQPLSTTQMNSTSSGSNNTSSGRPSSGQPVGCYPMKVECSDLYGRIRLDLDGMGDSGPVIEKEKATTTATATIDVTTTTTTTTAMHKAIDVVESDGAAAAVLKLPGPPQPYDVPPRTCTVLVSLLPIHNNNNTFNHVPSLQQNTSSNNNNNNTMTNFTPTTTYTNTKNVTVTLSAALSSCDRIKYDTSAAYQIALALDELYDIPMGLRLQDWLDDESICHANLWAYQPSDKLDFIIAYLRRIHLFSYYNGCCFVNHSVCDVVTGKNAISTIHVRMRHADEFLQELQQQQEEGTVVLAPDNDAADENPPFTTADNIVAVPPPPVQATKKDLLVQRLDDAIGKALYEYCGIEAKPGEPFIVTDDDQKISTIAAKRHAELVADVKAIEHDQNIVQVQTWLFNHITDSDGRSRCGFTCCKKLFKDTTFLTKHLLKKHSDFLHAEQAKSHDEYMMKAWDAAAVRPVPDILVDCGTLFGTVACPIVGTIPTCIDPEPELWRNELERRHRVEEMKVRRSEMRNQQHQQNVSTSDLYQQSQQPRPPRANFIDVDDMKVEKVELSFDNVIVPATAVASNMDGGGVGGGGASKKKKRKLL